MGRSGWDSLQRFWGGHYRAIPPTILDVTEMRDLGRANSRSLAAAVALVERRPVKVVVVAVRPAAVEALLASAGGPGVPVVRSVAKARELLSSPSASAVPVSMVAGVGALAGVGAP
ncbi:hypothetical protein [Acidiferrimicrobium sp. IK]|uniref:hypothetical protein n=1 Tax=Acidiferrimicrobium sp. IK TaxID=2871700 RepID=UPI0021CB2239|nr:hypothetical protein [Acidiferrimicrobium sp. IK]